MSAYSIIGEIRLAVKSVVTGVAAFFVAQRKPPACRRPRSSTPRRRPRRKLLPGLSEEGGLALRPKGVGQGRRQKGPGLRSDRREVPGEGRRKGVPEVAMPGAGRATPGRRARPATMNTSPSRPSNSWATRSAASPTVTTPHPSHSTSSRPPTLSDGTLLRPSPRLNV